jgi:hypothetical protein
MNDRRVSKLLKKKGDKKWSIMFATRKIEYSSSDLLYHVTGGCGAVPVPLTWHISDVLNIVNKVFILEICFLRTMRIMHMCHTLQLSIFTVYSENLENFNAKNSIYHLYISHMHFAQVRRK